MKRRRPALTPEERARDEQTLVVAACAQEPEETVARRRGLRRAAEWAWGHVEEPRTINALMAVVYAFYVGLGGFALSDPPQSIAGQLGLWMPYWWGGFLAIGGVVGAVAAPAGLRYLERPAIYAVAAGALMYGSNVLALHFTEEGNLLPQAMVVLVTVPWLIMRFIRIRDFAHQPGK